MWKTAFKKIKIGRPYHFKFFNTLTHLWFNRGYENEKEFQKNISKFPADSNASRFLQKIVNLKCIFNIYNGIQNDSPVPKFFSNFKSSKLLYSIVSTDNLRVKYNVKIFSNFFLIPQLFSLQKNYVKILGSTRRAWKTFFLDFCRYFMWK